MNSPDSPVPQRYDIKTKASVEIGQEMDALDFTGSKEYAPSMRSFLGERRNNFMTFATSPFVMLCLFMAILLNRTLVYAAVRRPSSMGFMKRLVLRLVPVLVLSHSLHRTLLHLRCVSPSWATFLHLPVPTVCENDPKLLWFAYKCICLSAFVETFESAVVARSRVTDHGLTLFEYAFAFTEASMTGVNEEVLTITLWGTLGSLIGQVSMIFWGRKYRLLWTTFLGVGMLTYFGARAFMGHVFEFPTIIIAGFMPHLLASLAIVLCTAIYLFASMFVSHSRLSNHGRIEIALHEDFFAILMKTALLASFSAIETQFLHEYEHIYLPLSTYLEAPSAWGKSPYAQEMRVGQQDKQRRRETLGTTLLQLAQRSIMSVRLMFRAINVARLQPQIRYWDEEDDYARFLAGDLLEEDDVEYVPMTPSSKSSSSEDEEEDGIFRRDEIPIGDLVSDTLQDAEIVQSHFGSKSIVTRAQHASHVHDASADLVSIIQKRRQFVIPEESMSSICIICQVNPRQCLVLPCRCLAICEDCRIELALRNHSNCTACRQPVAGYSKVFVP